MVIQKMPYKRDSIREKFHVFVNVGLQQVITKDCLHCQKIYLMTLMLIAQHYMYGTKFSAISLYSIRLIFSSHRALPYRHQSHMYNEIRQNCSIHHFVNLFSKMQRLFYCCYIVYCNCKTSFQKWAHRWFFQHAMRQK